MQLGHAVEGWAAAHDHALSPSTRHDIERIGDAIEQAGHAGLPCSDVGEPHRRAIIGIAESRTSLSGGAIGEFLTIAVNWGRTAASDPMAEALPSDADALVALSHDLAPAWSLDATEDTVGPHWADDEAVENGELGLPTADVATSVAGPDPGHAAIEAPAPAVDELDPIGRDATGPEDPGDREPGTDHLDADVESATSHDQLVDEDDLDIDELATTDHDQLVDEDDLDIDELATIDRDLATGDYDSEPMQSDPPPELDTGGAVLDDPAASSFLRVLGQSNASTKAHDEAKRPDTPAPAPAPDGLGGVFSEAAQYDGHQRSIDWLTIAYFLVAAICFGFVIYFYLSS